MSIWDYVPFGDEISDFAHEVTGIPSAQQKREQQNLINEQIKSYKDQTELSREELNMKKDQVQSEKRRVEEKQIRALRGNYRTVGGGFLGSQVASNQQTPLPNASESGMSNKLGA